MAEKHLTKEQYEATLRDPVAFRKDGDVSRRPFFLFLLALASFGLQSPGIDSCDA